MLIAIAIAPVFGEIQISNWEYSKYSNNNWLSENFSSGWSTGNSPFGTPSYFTVSTNADYKHIYVRKIIALNDSTQGIIKVRAENNLKCYANGNLVAERHGFIQKGNQHYNCYLHFFSDGCPHSGALYYYDDYNDQNSFVYVEVSKYLKKGNNVIACEAWVDSNAYYYDKKHIDGRLYLEVNFLALNSSGVLWSKTDKNFYKTDVMSSIYDVYSCSGSYSCGYSNAKTWAIVSADYWRGQWQWGNLPVSDESYFKWTDRKCQPGGGSCKYIDPIWPYDSTNLYMRKWMWSDSNETKTLQISDTKLPECYVNGIKINLTSFNSPYWKYTSNVKLNVGQNLIACMSPKINVNSFDMRVVEVNGPIAIVSVANDSEIKTGSETIFTIMLANYSHPETHVALTLEAWGQTDYQQLLTETNSGTAIFSFTPQEPGTYDLLVTALDLYDNDVATFSMNIDAAVASNEQYGFFPLSGNSDAKGGDGNILVAALVAATGGAAAAGIYAFKGTSQGFSISRIENSLNRASRAMSTLSYVANANAQANQESFMATMAQRFNEFKAKFNAIEEEKQKIKEEEEETRKRVAQIDAKNAALSYKPPEEKPMTWAEWYAQQGVPMLANRQNPVIFSSSWSAIAEQEKNKVMRQQEEQLESESKDISEEMWLTKVSRGIMYGLTDMWNDLSGFVTKRGTSLLTNPVGTITDDTKTILDGLNVVKDLIAARAYNMITNPIGTITGDMNAVAGAVNSYVEAFKKDPVDTFAKTMIAGAAVAGIVGGAVLAPITGGGSLVLTAAGIASLTGAGLIAGNEVYQYATAKTEDELKQKATDDNWDDALWMVGGLLQGTQMLKLGTAIKPAGVIEATSDDIRYAAVTAGVEPDKIVRLRNAPAFVDWGNSNLIKSFEKMKLIKNVDYSKVYYVENIDRIIDFDRLVVEWHEGGHILHMNNYVEIPKWIATKQINAEAVADNIASIFVGRNAIINEKSGYWLRMNNLQPFKDNVQIPSWIDTPWSKYTISLEGVGIIENTQIFN